jgi:hypothetical protein
MLQILYVNGFYWEMAAATQGDKILFIARHAHCPTVIVHCERHSVKATFTDGTTKAFWVILLAECTEYLKWGVSLWLLISKGLIY